MDEDEDRLLSFSTASVELYARSIVNPASINVDTAQEIPSISCKANSVNAPNVGKILFCHELQYRNATVYERFVTSRKKIEDAIAQVQKATTAIQDAATSQLSLSLSDLRRAALVDTEIGAYVTQFLKCYSTCFPIRHLVRFAHTPLLLSPICSYQTADFEIDAGQQYLLLEKQRHKWKVQARDKSETGCLRGCGPVISVPSLFFFIHWLTDDAESIQRLLARLRHVLSVYVLSLATHLLQHDTQTQLRTLSLNGELERLNKALAAIAANPHEVSQSILAGLQAELTAPTQRGEGEGEAGVPEKEKEEALESIVHCLATAVRTHLSTPDRVADQSKVGLNRRLKISAHKPVSATNTNKDELVHVKWTMRLVLNKCATTTETTEDIPSNFDADRFATTENATERNMVILAVVDPSTGAEIGLTDAVARGIVDYSTGTYRDESKDDAITIDEAILKGLIRVDFVSVHTEEKKKSFGTITVEDLETKARMYFIVHSVLDRLSGKNLDFDAAVERQLLNFSDGTYWDSLRNEALSISDALEKGYLDGSKVEDQEELEKLTKARRS